MIWKCSGWVHHIGSDALSLVLLQDDEVLETAATEDEFVFQTADVKKTFEF